MTWFLLIGFAGAIWSECIVDPDSCVAFPRLFGCQPFVQCANPELTPEQKCNLEQKRIWPLWA